MPDPHKADMLQATVIADIALVLIVGAVLVQLARRIRQPAVIGEITAGILLGPSLLGLLPGDLPHRLFPAEARPFLATIAQIGLLLFMFTIGWELDLATLRRGQRSVASVTAGSMVLPFLLGLGVAAYCYQHHSVVSGHHVSFWAFALYLGVSMSITAFPVLARILTDNRLGSTRVGTLALTSAALGDVLAWCLLAGVVAIVTASGPGGFATILWWSAGYVSAMVVLVRPALAWTVKRVTAYGRWPLAGLATAGLLLSAYTTSKIGIHPIFGAFAFGLAMPREPRELLEEQVLKPLQHAGGLLLPVYFIVTGLSVNIAGLSGTAWVELLLVLTAACAGKLFGATLPARMSGMPWRESMGVGVLMNTRGLTELIILNVGLSLKVLDGTLFTEMVLMALLTTAMAGPILPYLLPRTRIDLAGRGRSGGSVIRLPSASAATPPTPHTLHTVRQQSDAADLVG